jgi:hypothetical protein
MQSLTNYGLKTIDSWDFERNSIRYRAFVAPDESTALTEFGHYDAAAVRAFKKGEWRFVGCIVIPLMDGVDPEATGRSRWSLEWRDRDGLMAEIVPSIADDVRGNLKFLHAVLGAALAVADPAAVPSSPLDGAVCDCPPRCSRHFPESTECKCTADVHFCDCGDTVA